MQTHTRGMAIRADSIDGGNRSLEAVVATESAVAVWSDEDRSLVDEILLIDGAEIPSQVPFLLDHVRQIRATIGSARNFRRDGAKLVADLHFADGIEAAEDAWRLAFQRHAGDISIGYRVLAVEVIRPGETKVVNGRSFTAQSHLPLHVVTKWSVKECSFVAVGADAAATIRSEPNLLERSSRAMDATLPQTIGRDVGSMTFAQLATARLRSDGRRVPENSADQFRAANSTVEGLADLTGIVNGSLLPGWQSAPDSLSGLYVTQPVSNYLAAKLGKLTTRPTLVPVGRGEVAPHMTFALDSTGWALMRYGVQFVIDEQDAADGKPISAYRLALNEIGMSIRRLISDLLWSIILQNPALADGDALFHTNRGNIASGGASALDATSLDSAVAAIAGQTGVDADNLPVHLGAQPRFLFVPPALDGPARRLARAMKTGSGGDLIVRSESRLAAGGVVDPRTGEVETGSNTNWLLAAPGEQSPSIVLGLLDGQREPLIRSFELTGSGEWGIGFDVTFSCGAVAVDGKPLYWSDGA